MIKSFKSVTFTELAVGLNKASLLKHTALLETDTGSIPVTVPLTHLRLPQMNMEVFFTRLHKFPEQGQPISIFSNL